MKVIIDGVQYNTDTATLLGKHIRYVSEYNHIVVQLYLTPDGRLFFFNKVYGLNFALCDESIRPCSVAEAFAWANTYCQKAQLRLSESRLLMTAQDLVLLADYRSGSPLRQKSYVHHVIFGTQDKSVYYIASNRIIEPIDYQTQVVSVTGVEDVKDFCERMCVRSMCEEKARAWAENHLPPYVYARCFGSAEV